MQTCKQTAVRTRRLVAAAEGGVFEFRSRRPTPFCWQYSRPSLQSCVVSFLVFDLLVQPAKTWWCDFSRRKQRWEPECPSHVRRPDTGTRKLAAESSRRLSADVTPRWESSRPANVETAKAASVEPRPKLLQRLHSAHRWLTGSNKRLADDRAEHLPKDWDHLPLTLTEVLWARIFVYSPLAVHAVAGMLRLVGVLALRRRGLLATPRRDQRSMCFELLLETSCAVFVQIVPPTDGASASGSDGAGASGGDGSGGGGVGGGGGAIATFAIPLAAKVLSDGDVQLGELSGELNLDARQLTSAAFDGEALAPADAFLLLWLALVGQNHPQIHAFATWGINHVSGTQYLRSLGVTSIYFNHLGLRGFPRLCGVLHSLGVLRVCTQATAALILGRTEQNPPAHKHIKALAQHSKLVHFIVRVRGYFLMQFEKHRPDFQGCDGESLFLGTVMHSVDHHQAMAFDACDMEWEDPAFRGCYEIATLVRSGFTSALRLAHILFDRRFSAGRHALFRDVHEFAHRINPRMADGMECAIIR